MPPQSGRTRRQEADSFSRSDLPLLSKLADQAHTKTEELRKADGQAGEGAVRRYAVTSHSSQGQTADHVLIHVDTEPGAKDLHAEHERASLLSKQQKSGASS